jgi:hypothetical protein
VRPRLRGRGIGGIESGRDLGSLSTFLYSKTESRLCKIRQL